MIFNTAQRRADKAKEAETAAALTAKQAACSHPDWMARPGFESREIA
jgi:hypothetical protein